MKNNKLNIFVWILDLAIIGSMFAIYNNMVVPMYGLIKTIYVVYNLGISILSIAMIIGIVFANRTLRDPNISKVVLEQMGNNINTPINTFSKIENIPVLNWVVSITRNLCIIILAFLLKERWVFVSTIISYTITLILKDVMMDMSKILKYYVSKGDLT